jgi:hypothetical protein
MEAYRSMLFSAAIPKSKFFQLFGIPYLGDEDWPAFGLPGFLASDRGPGASNKVVMDMETAMPIRELAPSWSGQSKAPVESSHPREPTLGGAPTHNVSELNVMEMVRREIVQACRDNHTSSIGTRLLGITGGENVIPTPHHAWLFLSKIGRTAAFPMPFAEAVRTFLTPVELVLSRDELRLERRVYDSPAMRNTGLYERTGSDQTIKLSGYCLPLCVRHCWVEVNGQLIELTAQLALRGSPERTYVSLDDLKIEAESHRLQLSRQRGHATAAAIEYMQKFEEDVGTPFDANRRVSGAPIAKSKQASNLESRRLRALKKQRRSA